MPPTDRDEILSLSYTEFENYLADLWAAMGCGIETTQRSDDGGIDVYAYPPGETRPIVIQAKHYNPTTRVGVTKVREIAGAAQRENTPYAALVTTSTFTKAATKEARQMDVDLIDGAKLDELHDRYMGAGQTPINEVLQRFLP